MYKCTNTEIGLIIHLVGYLPPKNLLRSGKQWYRLNFIKEYPQRLAKSVWERKRYAGMENFNIPSLNVNKVRGNQKTSNTRAIYAYKAC